MNDSNNTDNSIANSNNDNSKTAAANGSGASNGGDVTVTYSVNNAELSGSVTGQASEGLSVDYAALSGGQLSNTIDGSLNGAGLNQVAQNLGSSSLIQQQVSFQGNVNVNQ